jgi:hypothetical protein
MLYQDILRGESDPMDIYDNIARCLEKIELLPYLLETIYREATALSEEEPDHLRFALLRLQVYADIHRYENMEETQKIKYVSQVLEKVIFGSLLLEHEMTAIE